MYATIRATHIWNVSDLYHENVHWCNLAKNLSECYFSEILNTEHHPLCEHI